MTSVQALSAAFRAASAARDIPRMERVAAIIRKQDDVTLIETWRDITLVRGTPNGWSRTWYDVDFLLRTDMEDAQKAQRNQR